MANLKKGGKNIYIKKKLGKCCTEQKKHLPLQSQLRNHCDNMVELAIVVPKVVGSNPIFHPTKIKKLPSIIAQELFLCVGQ